MRPFEEVDRILRDAAGFRMGPFELMDLTGVDVSHPVMESIYDQFYQEPRFRPSYLLRQRYVAGLLGRKVGRGFYEYRDGKLVPPSERPAAQGKRVPVAIVAAEVAWRAELRKLVESAGWQLDTKDKPAANALCLVAPLGEDATTAALNAGLDARRTVAVDMLFGLSRRRSVMTTPLTEPEYLASAQALLGADGTPVSCLRDSPGFVAQRVVAMIINIGCDIAQQRIATPEDIDHAVQLGLGYPRGPLAMGDALGPMRVLAILDALSALHARSALSPEPVADPPRPAWRFAADARELRPATHQQGCRMAETIKILGMSGSLRKASYNTTALRAAQKLVPAGAAMETFDIAPIPLYNEDVKAAGFPAPVQALRNKIAAADALLM